MRLVATVSADIADALAREKERLASVTTAAVNRAAVGLRDGIRDQMRSSFTGDRLPRAVRARTYPEGRRSVGAAGLVWIAVPWINAHIEGAVITADTGRYLAIPLPEAEARGYDRQAEDRSTMGRFAKGSGGGNAMVAAAVRDFGKLSFIPTAGGGVLVARQGRQQIPLFALRRMVRLPARLDIARLSAEWLRRLADDIAAAYADGSHE